MISRSLFTENKNLRIFDFDDTLVKTNSYIYVTHSNGMKSKLTPGQYAVYSEKPGDVYDFKDFEQVKDPQEITKITTILRKIVQKSKEPVYILTARAAANPIKQYLKDIGINSNKINIIALASALLAAAVQAVWWPVWPSLTWPGLVDLLDLRHLVAHDNGNDVDDTELAYAPRFTDRVE
jgi:hypothetical protein